MKPVALYEMFPFLAQNSKLSSDYLSMAQVSSVTLNTARTKMEIELRLAVPAAPFEITIIEQEIAAEYSLETVIVHASVKAQPVRGIAGQARNDAVDVANRNDAASHPGVSAKIKGIKSSKSKNIILGRVIKAEPKPMGDVTIDDGKVAVRGFVCADRSRNIERNKAHLLNFDITDYTGTVNVSKFMMDEKAQKVTSAISIGMYLTVSGTLKIYKGELTLEPQNIFESEFEKREDTAEEKRVELHLHTKMSAGDALTDVGEVVARAAGWGHKAIAITDHGVVHAFPDAAAAAKKAAAKTGNDIKIIYGVEGYLVDDGTQDDVGDCGSGAAMTQEKAAMTQDEGAEDDGRTQERPLQDEEEDSASDVVTEKPSRKRHMHVILLAQNKAGLNNMYKLISKSHTKHLYKKRPTIYKGVLAKYREGLLIGSACERGEVFSAITAGCTDEELQNIAKFYDYLEIQPLCNNRFMLTDEKNIAKNEDDLKNFNRRVIATGKALNKLVVAASDAHFLDPEHEVFRKIIQLSKGFDKAPYEELPIYFRTTDEMLEEFAYLGEETAREVVITNTNKIADMCEKMSPLPPDKQFFPPKLENSAKELEESILAGLERLYGSEIPEIVTKRIDAELKDILRLGYDVIYMAAQKLVAYLKSKGSRVGSRGSVGSSFVAYISGITEVNALPAHYLCPKCKKFELSEDSSYACGADMPDKHCPRCGEEYIKDGFNIPFETFLGFDGDKIPDIDLNISGEFSEEAQRFVYDMFGEKYVYRAGTIGTIKEKKAYGMVRKYLEAIGKNATKAEENRLISGCLGVRETTGQHPGGLIVIPQDKEVNDFCPIQYPANDEKTRIFTTHFDYHKMEDHLIKLDMLGHDNPTMLVMLEKMTGVNADDIKLDDPDTMSIFTSPERLGLPDDDEIIGETGAIGIPEFGTPFARQMLCDTQPAVFDTLVRLSGYSHGEKVWIGNAQDLLATGKITVAETISSRDDIMLYLISVGIDAKYAFKISESVRKGRGLPEGSERELHSHRVPQWYVDSCKKISYLFPRAHAVAYVDMAFRIAWFKVHRPLEYYSAQFYRRSQNGAFDAFTMTRGIEKVKTEIYRIRNLPAATKKEEELIVSLESCYEFYMRGYEFLDIDLYESEAERFVPIMGTNQDGPGSGSAKGYLRPPFVSISGLGDTAAHSLVENREGRRFISIEEISAACPGVNKSNLDDLMRIGALGDMPETSQMSLF